MPEWLKEWWPAIAFLVPFIIGAVVWAVRKGLVSKEEMAAATKAQAAEYAELKDQVNRQLGELDRRTIQIESEIKHLPTAADIGQLRVAIANLSGTALATERELQSVSRMVNRIDDNLTRGVTA